MFLDNLLLWLHVGAAIFCVGPVTVATSFTPRYIRQGELPVVRFLMRITRVFGVLTLLVFLTGLVLGRDQLAAPWLTVSMTLFIVAFALLFAMVQRDQSAAVKAMSAAAGAGNATRDEPATPADTQPAESGQPAESAQEGGQETARQQGNGAAGENLQTGRIAAFSGVIALLWLVILVFMVWQPGA